MERAGIVEAEQAGRAQVGEEEVESGKGKWRCVDLLPEGDQ